MDYFEIDRLIEDLAKIHSTALATTWFKITKRKPSVEEYRLKVIEFIDIFRDTMTLFPDSDETDLLKDHVFEKLSIEIKNIIEGKNKEVEKRYKYFINYI